MPYQTTTDAQGNYENPFGPTPITLQPATMEAVIDTLFNTAMGVDNATPPPPPPVAEAVTPPPTIADMLRNAYAPEEVSTTPIAAELLRWVKAAAGYKEKLLTPDYDMANILVCGLGVLGYCTPLYEAMSSEEKVQAQAIALKLLDAHRKEYNGQARAANNPFQAMQTTIATTIITLQRGGRIL